MRPNPITFRPLVNTKYDLRQVARELGFFSTSQLIITALNEYLMKRNIEVYSLPAIKLPTMYYQ